MTESTNVRPALINLNQLWAIFLSGPVVWTVHFLTIYAFAEFGCATTISTLTIAGINGVTLAVIIITVIALVVLLYATFTAYQLSGEQSDENNATADLKHFMSQAGWVMNALFSVVVVMTAIPVVWFSSCANINFFSG